MEGDAYGCSDHSKRTVNYIRQIVDRIEMPKNPAQPIIPLSIGDPTKYGNLLPPAGVAEEVARVVSTCKHNGYINAMGDDGARAAVAASLSTPAHLVPSSNVAITCGCSHALLLAMDVLCDAGSNVLIPSPGFSLYRTLADYLGVEYRLYNLLAHQNWEVDLVHLESLVTPSTKAILVNNPSNPCGSNYSRQHLQAIVAVAEKHRIPIISDEVYAHMVFEGETFHSLQDVSLRVPILVCGGLAKRYMVPGWRVGWVALCDRDQVLEKGGVTAGLMRLSQTILGATSFVQAVVPFLLTKTPESYYKDSLRILQENAEAFVDAMVGVEGLSIVVPKAAMYCMVGIDMKRFPDFPSDVEFAQRLLDEQQVFVLPGSCFTMPAFFRVVLCAPKETMVEAARRIRVFCGAHLK